MSHELRHASQLYGYFASILGLISFLFIAAQITLYAAEFNVVRVRRLYPRGLSSPPTTADEIVLGALVAQSRRRAGQSVQVTFDDQRGPLDG